MNELTTPEEVYEWIGESGNKTVVGLKFALPDLYDEFYRKGGSDIERKAPWPKRGRPIGSKNKPRE